jgi:hypothetical protein
MGSSFLRKSGLPRHGNGKITDDAYYQANITYLGFRRAAAAAFGHL